MKPRADRPPISWPHPSPAPRRPSSKPGAVRARRHRQRRKNGIRYLIVEMSELDIQSLAKTAPQDDPAVERAIQAMLRAAPRNMQHNAYDRDREATEQSSQVPGDQVCACCGAVGVVGYFQGALLLAEIRGERFLVHSRCLEPLAARLRCDASEPGRLRT
jgi:hypothetical protein